MQTHQAKIQDSYNPLPAFTLYDYSQLLERQNAELKDKNEELERMLAAIGAGGVSSSKSIRSEIQPDTLALSHAFDKTVDYFGRERTAKMLHIAAQAKTSKLLEADAPSWQEPLLALVHACEAAAAQIITASAPHSSSLDYHRALILDFVGNLVSAHQTEWEMAEC